MTKDIRLEAFGRVHNYFRMLASTPPDGYTISLGDRYSKTVANKWFDTLIQSWVEPMMSPFKVPEKLFGSFVNYLSTQSDNSSLTLTNGLLSFRHRPWIPVVEDAVNSFVGYHHDLKRFHPIVQHSLASKDCKAIVYFFEATRKSLEATYDTSTFYTKLKHVPLGIPLARKRKRNKRRSVNILFLGSVNFNKRKFQDFWFYNRGGHIAIRSYLRLRYEFDNLVFTIRSSIPSDYRKVLSTDPKVSILDGTMSSAAFDDLLWSTDICLLPIRDTPWGAFLDAMSHQLPIVTVNMHANSELVHNGKSGFVCEVPSLFDPIVNNYYVRDNATFKRMWDAWVHGCGEITDRVVDSMRTLIKNEETRETMGEEGRKMLEPSGPFSVQNRNSHLKRVLDEATA